MAIFSKFKETGLRAGSPWPELLTEYELAAITAYLRNDLSATPSSRPLQLVELCCGTGNLSKAFIKQGWHVRSLDLKIDILHDLTTHEAWGPFFMGIGRRGLSGLS